MGKSWRGYHEVHRIGAFLAGEAVKLARLAWLAIRMSGAARR